MKDLKKLSLSFFLRSWSEYYEPGGDPRDANCGYDGGDEYWYMGTGMCFRANAAFTLYGILSGESDHGCSSGTYINSFMTTWGAAGFMQAVEDSGAYVFNTAYEGRRKLDQGGGFQGVSAECVVDDGNDDGGNDGDRQTQAHLSREYPNAVSYTTGCYMEDFVYSSFNGAYCDGGWVTNHVQLNDLNKELNNLGCVKIYDANNGIDAATDLLSYSASCSIRQYPDRCPDPYGHLMKYTVKLEKATGSLTTTLKRRVLNNVAMWTGYILGFFLMLFSCYITGKAVEDAENKRAEMQLDDSVSRKRNAALLVGVGVVKTASMMKERAQNFAEATENDGKEPVTEEVVSSDDGPIPMIPADNVKNGSAAPPSGKKYKRPRLARLSRRLFKGKKKG